MYRSRAVNVAVTRAAEGFPRRAFSVDDVRRMMEAGIIGIDEKFELIEGELVMMSAKSIAHDNVKHALNLALARIVPDGVYVGIEATLQLAANILVEPDIAVISRAVYKADPKSFARPSATDVLLLIEVAVSSMAYDRNIKARLYARHGIREFWVIDANERITWVHTGPTGEGWSSIVERGPQETLTSEGLPGFAFRLADID
jgi:Uma2 family endonuclease